MLVTLKIKKKMKMMKERKRMKKRMKKRKTMMMKKKLKLRKPPPVRELMLALTAVELLSLFRSLENIYFKKKNNLNLSHGHKTLINIVWFQIFKDT